MSRKKLILIIVIIVAVLGGAIFLFISREGGGGSADRNGSGFLGLFPNNDSDPGDSFDSSQSTSTPRDGDDQIIPIPTFRQISNTPVSGYVVFESGVGSSTIRYIERESGHIFETATSTLATKRLSNTTIPRIKEVLWFDNGGSLIMRYLDESDNIQTFLAKLNKEEGQELYILESEALPQNILVGDIFGDDFFAILRVADSSKWRIYDNQGNERNITTNPLKEWLPDFWQSNTVSIQRKSSNGIPSHLYFLNTSTVSLEEVLSNISGLTTKTSPDGKYVFYSTSSGSLTLSFIYDTEDETSSNLSITTLADKCTWSEDNILYCGVPNTLGNNLPDNWYQGLTSFNDSLWSISPSTLTTSLIFNPQDRGKGVDVVNMEIDNNFLFFINKKDSTLWSLDLERI